MKTINKITKVKNGSISFEELKEFNGKEVEVIISQIENPNQQKVDIMKYAGCIKSGPETDITNEEIDRVIYE